jgi:hypothetical protein
MKPLTSYE